MDCITLHQYGITNVVASLGTALTINQAKLLKRYADNVIISYDADIAGQTATLRGLKILRNIGLLVKVLIVPEGKDPDEFIRKNGKNAFEELINNAIQFIEYRIKKAKEGVNLKDNDELLKYIKTVADILVDLDPVEKDIYIKKISEDSGIKEQSIYDLLNKESHKNTNDLHTLNNIDAIGQKLYLEPAFLKAERLLLKFMQEDDDAYNYIISQITDKEFNMESHSKIYNLLIENINLEREIRKKVIELKCDDLKSSSEWVSICEETVNNDNCEIKVLIDDYIMNVKKFKLEESKKDIMKNIKEYEQNGLLEQSLTMVKKLNDIQNEINKLV